MQITSSSSHQAANDSSDQNIGSEDLDLLNLGVDTGKGSLDSGNDELD